MLPDFCEISIAFPAKIASFSAPQPIKQTKTVDNSGNRRIAQRYVKALFDVANSASAVDKVEADLSSLLKAHNESPEFRQLLVNPLLSRDAQAKAMLALLDKIKVDQVTRQFIGMLVSQKRLPLLPDVAKLFIEWASSARGELKAELITAAPLKDKEIALVAERLGKAYGRKMHLEVRQDPALLGGVVVKIGSLQLDSSLAGKIERLKVALQAA